MKTLLLSICLLFCAICISAQTYYYNTTRTFSENGYTYQCDTDAGSKYVTLYNKNNKLTYVDMVNKVTGEYYFPAIDDPEAFKEEAWVEPKCTAIINNAFSTSEKQRVKGYKLSVILNISPDTGKVMEVRFNLLSHDPFATIPVSVYRNIEVQLKAQIWFSPTAEAKKYNYLFYGWNQAISSNNTGSLINKPLITE